MEIYNGVSQLPSGEAAVAEAVAEWPEEVPSMILVFHSTQQDAEEVAAAIEQRYAGIPCAGCTTSGEHLNGEHYKGSLVMAGIWSPEVQWSVQLIENIQDINSDVATSAVDRLLDDLHLDRDHLSAKQQFCLAFIDGLARREEMVAALVAEALEGIPLLGGSAGDDLKFVSTKVIANGKACEQGAVLVMGDSSIDFEIVKHQHFTRTPRQLVITKVDSAQRRVYEMDGVPANQAYADILGVSVHELTPDLCFINPLVFRANNELYVRSIQRIEDDGSIVFYCGVEQGMVLEVGGHEPMEQALSSSFANRHSSAREPAELFIACNCILRSLEADKEDKHTELGKVLVDHNKMVIGFDTYGEQLNGLHINQTLVGLALGRRAA
jgi:hypothetical protein